jgi:hypothetical protein
MLGHLLKNIAWFKVLSKNVFLEELTPKVVTMHIGFLAVRWKRFTPVMDV